MEQWREELMRNLQVELEDDESEEHVWKMAVAQMGDFEDEEKTVQVGGSRPGRAPNVNRNFEMGHQIIFQDYFSNEPVYGPLMFRRRFRMRRELFLRIMDTISTHDSYFVQRSNCVGTMGLSSLQKCTAALRILAYGVAADSTDEYCRIGESTAIESMKRFCAAVRACFGATYMRKPTRSDIINQMRINEERGWPGMFGSLDCMHWGWKNCPVAWQGQFQDKDGNRSIILEAIADQSLWIWHAFFGLPGGNNDLNVLDRSTVVQDILMGEGQDLTFTVNGNVYPRFYLLTDGIYPKWSCFVQSIHEPQGEKRKHFAEVQEATRKDIERCFGVLQARFQIVKNPCRQWDMDTMDDIMLACCIMHNMIIEDEQDLGLEDLFDPCSTIQVQSRRNWQYIRGMVELEHSGRHFALKNDLIDHLWQLKGEDM
jgi:hypothetical protein